MARVQVHLLVQGTPPVLAPDTNTVLFRVFQVIITTLSGLMLYSPRVTASLTLAMRLVSVAGASATACASL